MIYSNIDRYLKCRNLYPEVLQKALDYIVNTDFTNIVPGVYTIEGNDIFAKIIHTTSRLVENNRPEIHKTYIDLQYIVSGVEIIGVAHENSAYGFTEDKIASSDQIFYSMVHNEGYMKLLPKSFAIFFPNEVHRPECCFSPDKAMPIVKVVVKIKADIL